MLYHLRHGTCWAVALVVLAAATGGSAREATAAPFVNRPMTLSRSDWALDLGLGIGHLDLPGGDVTGLGLNLGVATGLTSFIQLGLRTGFRFGSDGRITNADRYGRTHETEHYGVGASTMANPEVSLKWALVDTSVVHLGVDGRLYLPIEDGTRVGIMVAVPVGLHLGNVARLDTGIYIPMIFYDDVQTVISFPFHLWFQANDDLYLGPLTGIRINNPGGTSVPLGLALGYSISYDADVKTWLLFPNVSGNTSNLGFGVGIQVRF